MKYKTVKNTSKRPILIDTPKGETVSIPAGETLNDIELDPVQVSNLEDINMLKAEKAKETKKEVETIELPAEFTADSLVATFNDEQLKAYCKSNRITGITGKKGAELAELIVDDYAAKNVKAPGQKEEN